jgi:hypothetical protein
VEQCTLKICAFERRTHKARFDERGTLKFRVFERRTRKLGTVKHRSVKLRMSLAATRAGGCSIRGIGGMNHETKNRPWA